MSWSFMKTAFELLHSVSTTVKSHNAATLRAIKKSESDAKKAEKAKGKAKNLKIRKSRSAAKTAEKVKRTAKKTQR